MVEGSEDVLRLKLKRVMGNRAFSIESHRRFGNLSAAKTTGSTAKTGAQVS